MLNPIDLDSNEQTELRISELYSKLYPYIAKDFRHVADCSTCHATLIGNEGRPIISTNAEQVIQTFALAQIPIHESADLAFTATIEAAKAASKSLVKG